MEKKIGFKELLEAYQEDPEGVLNYIAELMETEKGFGKGKQFKDREDCIENAKRILREMRAEHQEHDVKKIKEGFELEGLQKKSQERVNPQKKEPEKTGSFEDIKKQLKERAREENQMIEYVHARIRDAQKQGHNIDKILDDDFLEKALHEYYLREDQRSRSKEFVKDIKSSIDKEDNWINRFQEKTQIVEYGDEFDNPETENDTPETELS